METRTLLQGSQGEQSQDNHSQNHSPPGSSELPDNMAVLQNLEIFADQLKSILECVEVGWKQNLDGFVDKLRQDVAAFNFIAYRGYLTAIDHYRVKQCTTREQRSAAEKLQRLFLSFGFCIACADLFHCAGEKAKEVESGSAVAAARIVDEFQAEFTPSNFDPEVLFEKTELLWRIKKTLMEGTDKENCTRLGMLAERSSAKSCWWFFLGLVFHAAGSGLVLATHGVAIPYLTGLAEWSITGKPATFAIGMLTSETGLGVLWWQQKRYPTAFCCFWHRMEEARAKGEQAERAERARNT